MRSKNVDATHAAAFVHLAEYLGDGYWADYPPYEFSGEETGVLMAFVHNQKLHPNVVVRSVRDQFGLDVPGWEHW